MAQATARITLPDRYRVIRHVANGGMASVWEAHDELLNRAVAVKVLASHLSEDERARRRFAREARTAAGLSFHPHVVTIYDVAEFDGRSFIVMELLRGGTVADRLRGGEEIPHRLALRWLHEAGSALDAAHEAGVVHRDVKPANMLLDTRPTSSAGTADTGRLALADFGIARLGLEDQITQTGQVLGTAAYISPEQAMGEPSTPASDRYALAVVAFELLTGEKPFRAENFAAQARAHVEDAPPRASERDLDVPPAADRPLERGMAKEPGDRWASAGAMVEALEDALAAPPPPRRAGAVPEIESTQIMPDRTSPPPRADLGGTPPPARADGGGTPPLPRADLGATPPPARADGGGTPSPPRLAGAGVRGTPPPSRSQPAFAARRRWGAGALIALAALLLAVAGAVALMSGGGDDPAGERAERQQAQRTPTPEASATPEATAEATRTPEPTATATATPEAAATPEPKPKPKKNTGAGVSGDDPAALQTQAYTLNNAGDPEAALAYAEKAVALCEGSTAVSPCAYALFEYARALRLTGNPEGAIAALEQRQQRFPDDQAAAVDKELALAREAAGSSGE